MADRKGGSLQHSVDRSYHPVKTEKASNSEDVKIGERVVVEGKLSGILRYWGAVQFSQGNWAGVELDSTDGKNDGRVGGKRYFSCSQGHGLFVKRGGLTKEMQVNGMSAPDGMLSLQEDVNTLRVERDAIAEKNELLEEDLLITQQDVEDLKQDLNQSTHDDSEITNLTAQLEASKLRGSQLEESLVECTDQLKATVTNLSNSAKQLQDDRTKQAQYKTQLKDALLKIDVVNASAATSTFQNEELVVEVADLTSQLEELKATLAVTSMTSSGNVEALQTHFEQQQQQWETKKATLQAEAVIAKTQIEDLTAASVESTNVFNELEEMLNVLQAEKDALLQTNVQCQETMSEQQLTIQGLEDDVLQVAEETNADIEANHAKIEAINAKSATERTTLQDKVMELTAELTTVRDQLTTTKTEMTNAGIEAKSHFDSVLRGLNHEKLTLSETNEKLEIEIEVIKAEAESNSHQLRSSLQASFEVAFSERELELLKIKTESEELSKQLKTREAEMEKERKQREDEIATLSNAATAQVSTVELTHQTLTKAKNTAEVALAEAKQEHEKLTAETVQHVAKVEAEVEKLKEIASAQESVSIELTTSLQSQLDQQVALLQESQTRSLSLKEQYSALEQKVAALLAEVQSLEESKQQVETQLATATVELTQARSSGDSASTATAEAEKMTAHLHAVTQELQQVKTSLEGAVTERRTLEDAEGAAKTLSEEQQAKISTLEQHALKFKTEHEAVVSENAEMEEGLELLNKQLDDSITEKKEMHEGLEFLNDQVETYEAKIAQMEANGVSNGSNTGANTGANPAVFDLETKNMVLSDETEALKVSLSTVTSELETLTHQALQHTELKSKLATAEAHAQNWQTKLDTVMVQVTEQQAALDNQANKNNNGSNAISNTTSHDDGVRTANDSPSELVAILMENRNESEAEMDEMESCVVDLQKQYQQQKQLSTTLMSCLTQLISAG